MLWHGRHLLVSTLRKVRWEADQTDEVLGVADVQIPAIVAVHGSSVPWGRVDTDGVTVVPARRVPDLLRGLPPILGPQRVAWLADRARLRFAPLHIQVGGASLKVPLRSAARSRPWLCSPLPRWLIRSTSKPSTVSSSRSPAAR